MNAAEIKTPFISASEGIRAEYRETMPEGGVRIFHVTLKTEGTPVKEEMVSVCWKAPLLDCMGIWHPRCGFDRSIDADWGDFLTSMTAKSAPVLCIFSEDGENRFTLSASEAKEIIWMRAGVHEKNGTLLLEVQIPASYMTRNGSYSLELRLDTRSIPYYQAIREVSLWWETDCGIKPIPAYSAAKEPVYSTWYSYHQNLQDSIIEEECRLAAEAGFKTVILDDGWQTDDSSRGYAFCGDWDVSLNRFPDFREHVRRVHGMGMKYMIWYSVPFLGCKSRKWEEFKDKLLSYNDDIHFMAGILDPRYKEVRDYLADTYANAVEKYDLDGLKLDFIDGIRETPGTPAFQPGKMDIASVQEALDCMMFTVYNRIAEKKKDIMIEFRQSYIGPNMRCYGNMFRVTDCPNSAVRNRVGIVDLRMLSGCTAVHSDPLMWHRDETAELAATQIISSIFSTVQISVRMTDLSEDIQRMLKFWLGFMSDNKELLQDQPICALEPQNLYPVVWTQKDERAIMAVYAHDRVLAIPQGTSECMILNGTKGESMVLENDGKNGCVVVKDCFGQELAEYRFTAGQAMLAVKVPVSGMVCWNSEEA